MTEKTLTKLHEAIIAQVDVIEETRKDEQQARSRHSSARSFLGNLQREFDALVMKVRKEHAFTDSPWGIDAIESKRGEVNEEKVG